MRTHRQPPALVLALGKARGVHRGEVPVEVPLQRHKHRHAVPGHDLVRARNLVLHVDVRVPVAPKGGQ
eukprot:1194037-Prorocentrum_minimum.AAC.3